MTEIELRRLVLRYRLGTAPADDVIRALRQELERLDLRQLTGQMPETSARTSVLIECDQRRGEAHLRLDRGELDQAGNLIVTVRRMLERLDAMCDAEAAVARAEAETLKLGRAIGSPSLTALPSPRSYRDAIAEARAAIDGGACRLATAIAEHVIAEVNWLLSPSETPKAALQPLRTAIGEQRRLELELLAHGSAITPDPILESIDQLAASGRRSLAVRLAAELRIETGARHRCLERLWLLRASDDDARIRQAALDAAADAAAPSWRETDGQASRLVVENAGNCVEKDEIRLARLLEKIEEWS
jgi:hypothetical protein